MLPIGNRLIHLTAQDLGALGSAPEHSFTQGICIHTAHIGSDLLGGPPVRNGVLPQSEGVSVYGDAVNGPGTVSREHRDGYASQTFIQDREHFSGGLQEHQSADGRDIDAAARSLRKTTDRIGGQAVCLSVDSHNALVQTGNAHFVRTHPQASLPVYIEANRAGNAGNSLEALSVKAGQAAIAADVQVAVRRLRHDIRLSVGKAGEIIENRIGVFRLEAFAVLCRQCG